jgi:hypothetical protein
MDYASAEYCMGGARPGGACGLWYMLQRKAGIDWIMAAMRSLVVGGTNVGRACMLGFFVRAESYQLQAAIRMNSAMSSALRLQKPVSGWPTGSEIDRPPNERTQLYVKGQKSHLEVAEV